MKNFLIFFISIFYPVFFLLLGLLISPEYGIYPGFLIGTLLTLLAMLFSDKLLLSFFKVRHFKGPDVVSNFIKNTTFKLGIKKYYIFMSEGSNIYSFDGYFSVPRIVIGEDLIKNFSREESEALIFASFLRIKNKEAKLRAYLSVLLNSILAPFLLIPSQNLRIYLLSWRYFIRSFLFKNEKDLKEFDKGLKSFRVPFASANFKLAINENRKNLFLEDCAISENREGEVMRNFFDMGYDFEKRYKDLLRENGKT